MERGLLSDAELSSSYDEVVWLYLYQDFSHSPADRTAERTAIRFGITSWPQHFLVDPHSLAVLADTGRDLTSFRRAVADARVGPPGALTTDDLEAFDAIAAALEGEDVDVEAAREHLTHADVVVRFRAVQIVAKSAPRLLVTSADDLLSTPHDQIRFEVCKVLAAHGDDRAREALERLVRQPDNSRNPNVLRCRAVAALGRCGTPASIEVIAPFATSGEYYNGLTGLSIAALATLAGRFPEQTPEVRATLKRAFPPLPDPGDERALRSCVALASKVHATLGTITGEKRPFPEVYDEATRRQLIVDW